MTIPEATGKLPVQESLGEHPTGAEQQHGGHGGHGGHAGHAGHGWMMIACCIPMLAIAGLLVITGAADPSFLIVAVLCTAMMALMMGGMHGKGSGGSG